MKNAKYFIFVIFILVTQFITGCSDSSPTVTSCTASSTSTSASVTASACGSLSSTSATLTVHNSNSFEIKNPIDPYVYSSLGFYIPHSYADTNNEDTLTKDSSINLPSNSRFYTDKPFTYIKDDSLESMNIINEILCKITQTEYEDMVNMGIYKSLVNTNKCEFNYINKYPYDIVGQNHLSGSYGPAPELLTIEATKTDNNSPLIVTAWIHQEADLNTFKPQATIEVALEITENSKMLSSKIQNPYGISKMSYKAYSKSSKEILFKGYLKTEQDAFNNLILRFYNYGDFNINSDNENIFVKYDTKGVLKRKHDGSYGSGTISNNNVYGDLINTKTYNITYNKTHFLKEKDNSIRLCLSMNGSKVFTRDYRFYYNENSNTPGAPLDINSGVPIKYSNNSSIHYGFASYFGTWMSDNITLPDDALVKASVSDYDSSEDIYRVQLTDYRLKEIKEYKLDLSDVKNIPFTYYDEDINERYRIKWNGISFKIFKEFDKTDRLFKLVNEYDLDLTELHKTALSLWSDSLGGNVNITLDGCFDNENNTFNCSDFNDTSSIVTVLYEVHVNPNSNEFNDLYFWEKDNSDLFELSFLQDINNSSYLEFDPPAKFSYVHYQPDTSKFDNKYHGTTFFLRYSSYGGLFGLPGRCIDAKTGDSTDCFGNKNGQKSNFYTDEFNIPDGFRVSNDSEFYYVKALKRTESLKSLDLYSCFDSGLTNTTTNVLPDESLWEDPNLGEEPQTLLSPVVIGRVK